MKIFIGADHRGFALKNDLVDFLQSKNIRVEDLGSYELNPTDDYPQISENVAKAVLATPESVGIVICATGVGVAIAANRIKGIRCALGFDATQVQKAREDDAINMLALPSEYVDFVKAQDMIGMFLNSQPKSDEKYARRVAELDM